MRKINASALFIVLLLTSAINISAQTYNKQNTYLDALELKDIKSTDPQGFNDILLKYGNEDMLSNNPFLRNEMAVFASEKSDKSLDDFTDLISETTSGNSKDYNPSALNAANWQASAINGLANFMAGRFRQEMFQMSINQMFKQISDEKKSNLIQNIFPKTYGYIKNLYGKGNSSYYTADLLLLRQTAQIDMDQLPANIVKNPVMIFPKLKENPEVTDMLAMSDRIVEFSKEGQSLDKLITALSNEKYSSNSKIQGILNVTDIISQALLNNKENSTSAWVNPATDLAVSKTSLKNPEIKYFYGLLYQQLVQLPEFNEYLTTSDETVDVAEKIQNLILFVNKLNSTYDYLKSKDYHLQTPAEVINYVDNINQSITSFAKTVEQIPEINKYYHLSDSTIDISTKYISLVNATLNKDYTRVVPLLIVNLGNYLYQEDPSVRLLTFVAQLATIDKAEDMEALLNAYALPIGSSSIKRHSKFNLTLNGYVGLTGGFETAYGSEQNQTRNNIGLSAPIGLSTTFSNGHLTAFISFIDLGSVVNQRLGNDYTSYSNLRFEQFFTPGIGLYYNFPKMPISA